MEDSQGSFSEPQPSNRLCPKCKSSLTYQMWESLDGGYEDYKYTCSNKECGHYFWIDGIDS
jgi:uncharacterized protein with PIN domain